MKNAPAETGSNARKIKTGSGEQIRLIVRDLRTDRVHVPLRAFTIPIRAFYDEPILAFTIMRNPQGIEEWVL
jgi:hypothetical protein